MRPAGHVHHLRLALRRSDFRRLLGVRLAAQFGDGVFQASLAGAVLFNPERQAHAADVAAGFAVLLLPYSVLGPFAGVLLDRWSRQRVLVLANLARALGVLGIAAEIAGGLHGQPFYAAALVLLSISRFFLSGLSAALPHVIAGEELVTANSLSTTLGAIATTAGGALAIGARELVDGVGTVRLRGDGRRWPASPTWSRRCSPAGSGAARSVRTTGSAPPARRSARCCAGCSPGRGTSPTGARRCSRSGRSGCTGSVTACSRSRTVLLFRNYFAPEGPLRAGLAGLAQFIVLLAAGGFLAAVVTPAMTRRIGFVGWSVSLLCVAAAVEYGLVLPYRLPLHLLAGLLLGFAAQGIKICVDTLVQRHVADEFRGRVFALYDTLFNVMLVAAAVLTAVFLPDTGRAPLSVLLVGAAYLLTAVGYLRLSRRTGLALSAAAPTSA